jgi:hypothetical protein
MCVPEAPMTAGAMPCPAPSSSARRRSVYAPPQNSTALARTRRSAPVSESLTTAPATRAEPGCRKREVTWRVGGVGVVIVLD